MVEVHLRYVNRIIDRYGQARYYFRRNGKTYRLPDDPTSPEFLAEHARLTLETARDDMLPRRVAPAEGSLRALAVLYYSSAEFKDLEPRTAHNYRASIDTHLLVDHGHRPVAQMRRVHVMKIIGGMSKTPGAANYFLKRFKTLFEFAIKVEWRETNPASKVKGYKAGEFHTWTDDEIEVFEARWPTGTKQRLGFDALLCTGQRVSDVAPMTVPDNHGKIRVVQEKTGAKLVITTHPQLAASLAACPSGNLTVLVTQYGKPFTAKGFSNYISAAIRAAGLPERCVAHGLRKAAARRLAEAGCTEHEIMAVTGHTSLAEVQRYTRAVSQERLNQSAMAKVSPPPAT